MGLGLTPGDVLHGVNHGVRFDVALQRGGEEVLLVKIREMGGVGSELDDRPGDGGVPFEVAVRRKVPLGLLEEGVARVHAGDPAGLDVSRHLGNHVVEGFGPDPLR